jgi:hypothetical protein
MPRKKKAKEEQVEAPPTHQTGEDGYLYKDDNLQESNIVEVPTAVDATTATAAPPEASVQSEQPKEKPKLRSIIFVGDGEPKKKVRIGMLTIEMPDAETQRKGFETEHARLILTNLRGYKRHNPLKD